MLTEENIEFCPMIRAIQALEHLDKLLDIWNTIPEAVRQYMPHDFVSEVESAGGTLSCIKDET